MDTGIVVVLLLGLVGPSLAEYCTERRTTAYGSYTTRTIHCSFGCCGDYYDQYCCSSSTGMVVGIVFACIFTISVIIAIVCCCIKHKGQRGRIIQPSATTTQSVFIVPNNGPQPPPAYPYGTGNGGMYPPAPAYYPPQGGYGGAMPPAYSSNIAPPPAYTPDGPKYPTQQGVATPNPYAAAAGTGS